MLEKINNSKITEEIYCLAIAVASVLGWYFNSHWGYMAIVPITMVGVILLNDFKYFSISILGFIFANGNMFSSDASNMAPMQMIISGGLLGVVGLIYVIRNGIHLKRIKSGKALLLLAVMSPVPLIYHNVIQKEDSGLYFLYLNYLLYFLVYLLFLFVLDGKSFRFIKLAMGYMALLLAMECILYVYDNGFVKGYGMGWGICNEAGILMMVGIPFIFIDLIKARKLEELLIPSGKIGIILFGMFASTSRGTYIFGFVLVILLFVWTIITSKKRISILMLMLMAIGLVLLYVHLNFGFIEFFEKIKNSIFGSGLNSSGRFELFEAATDIWKTNFLTVTFGNGWVAEYAYERFPFMNVYVVYHSTFFQMLATLGVVGVILLLFHFYEKYKQLFKFDMAICVCMFVGYFIVDLYGMIDNTYGMYYYMLPLAMIMASIDNLDKKNNVDLI
jgi:hypothetical protein